MLTTFWWEDRGSCDAIEDRDPDKIRDGAGDGGFDGMRAKYCLQRWKRDEDDNAGVRHAFGRQFLHLTLWLSCGVLVLDHVVPIDVTWCVPIRCPLTKKLGGKEVRGNSYKSIALHT